MAPNRIANITGEILWQYRGNFTICSKIAKPHVKSSKQAKQRTRGLFQNNVFSTVPAFNFSPGQKYLFSYIYNDVLQPLRRLPTYFCYLGLNSQLIRFPLPPSSFRSCVAEANATQLSAFIDASGACSHLSTIELYDRWSISKKCNELRNITIYCIYNIAAFCSSSAWISTDGSCVGNRGNLTKLRICVSERTHDELDASCLLLSMCYIWICL